MEVLFTQEESKTLALASNAMYSAYRENIPAVAQSVLDLTWHSRTLWSLQLLCWLSKHIPAELQGLSQTHLARPFPPNTPHL